MKYIILYNNFKIKVNNYYDKNKGWVTEGRCFGEKWRDTKMGDAKNGQGAKKVGDQRSPLQFYNVTL